MYKFGVLCLFAVACARYDDAASKEVKAVILKMVISSGIKCLEDYPLSLFDISSFKNKIMPNNQDAKCFAACLFKDIGIMNDMGKIDPSTARDTFKEMFWKSEEHIKKADQLITFCSKVNKHRTSAGDKECERANLAFNCITKDAARFGFDFDFN